MKLNEIKAFEGECCPPELIKGETGDKLQCIICYQIMTKPVTLSCPAAHTFGMACLKDWIQQKQNIPCPYCRAPSATWSTLNELQNQLQKLVGVCNFCNKWEGNLTQLQGHKDNCPSYLEYLKKQLKQTVDQQIQELNIEINPHLKGQHVEIYDKYAQNWTWLNSDMRNWKWWWWCNNPWWENKPCLNCNVLWHKYQKKIDLLEQRRINILSIIVSKFGNHQSQAQQEQK